MTDSHPPSSPAPPRGSAARSPPNWPVAATASSQPPATRAAWTTWPTVVQPGPVSSGALNDILTYRMSGDPYATLLAGPGISAEDFVTPEYVAAAIADLIQRDRVPLRAPVGDVAELNPATDVGSEPAAKVPEF